ncbi:hypothetical protein QAD02_008547 [Eretmocerus hayati]|uniref:Uncharacterized protein n=1 Tax=Eretmocerus hayati TaxID=131215 RepID=A0ACC2NB90_9HYME|nr:hypothetical protein QAD02_008547 [Eretmocerus hayati]
MILTASCFFGLLLFLISNVTSTRAQLHFTSVVPTDLGYVVGNILTTVERAQPYAAFTGIPYAEPPIGELRFKPPVEKAPWNDVFSATADADMCIQIDLRTPNVIGSEDCLYLNVYTPHINFPQTNLKPVMVWIHGGAFKTGNSNRTYYGPDFLLEEDVVIVSFNYRLGPFGFLNLHHPNATGNMGLKDQNLVLRWVQRNIANFGGDPNQVTIFGQSAGSISVDLHILSEMSSGLFNQSIAMSGAPLCLYWGFQTGLAAEAQAFFLGAKLGVRTLNKDVLLEKLMSVPAEDLVKTSEDKSVIPFRPTLERRNIAPDQEKFLTECTLRKYYNGNYHKRPHLMGFTATETLSFARRIGDLLGMVRNAVSDVRRALLPIDLPVFTSIANLKEKGLLSLANFKVKKLIEESSDLLFVTGIDTKQRLLSVHNGYPIYYYRFSFEHQHSAHRSEGVNLDGVAHEDELPHIFYRPHLDLPIHLPEMTVTRRRFVRMLANFAKYQNPTPHGINDPLLNITWPDSGAEGTHLEFNHNLSVVRSRPTSFTVKLFQLAHLGQSYILNDCPKEIIHKAIDFTKSIVDKVAIKPAKAIKTLVTDSAEKISDTVSSSADAVSDAVEGGAKHVSKTLSNIKDSTKNAFSGVFKSLTGMLTFLKTMIIHYVLIIYVAVKVDCRMTNVIVTKYGRVRGQILETVISSRKYSSFKGIPYAEPPIGLLRFKPPIKVKPWSGVLDAKIEGANCVQKDFVYHDSYTGSEDCLYLNVYTPQIDFTRRSFDLKPVLVWIHGGSFKSGYGNSSLYGPDFFIEEDIVVVTFNYRLGPLGFLYVNHDDATGNAGLKDQNLVLRWVNENIIHFGGDPSIVTLCGQSAGGVSVDLHVLSDMSRGLFHRAISMSASCLCPWAFHKPRTAEELAFSLAENLGITTKDKKSLLQELRNVSAVKLVGASEDLRTVGPPFRPTLENKQVARGDSKFLTKCSYDRYQSGNFTKVPYLMGFTKDETLLFAEGLLPLLNMVDTPSKNESLMSSTLKAFPLISDGYKAMSRSMFKQLIGVTTNLLFLRGVEARRKLLERYSDQPVYFYHFCHDKKQSVHRLLYNINYDGVAHGDDLGYIFHMKIINLLLNPRDPEVTFRKKIARLWSNFAKYGNPTPRRAVDDILRGVRWPKSNKSGAYLVIDDKLVVRNWNPNPRDRFLALIYDIAMRSQAGCFGIDAP